MIFVNSPFQKCYAYMQLIMQLVFLINSTSVQTVLVLPEQYLRNTLISTYMKNKEKKEE